MRISDWSSDVCSSDLATTAGASAAMADRAAPDASRACACACASAGYGYAGGFGCGGVQSRARRRSRNTAIPIKNGRASCRERVCQYLKISGVDATLKKKKTQNESLTLTNITN